MKEPSYFPNKSLLQTELTFSESEGNRQIVISLKPGRLPTRRLGVAQLCVRVSEQPPQGLLSSTHHKVRSVC